VRGNLEFFCAGRPPIGREGIVPGTLAVVAVNAVRQSVRVGRLSITVQDRSSFIPTLTAALDELRFKVSDSMGEQLRFQNRRGLLVSEIMATLSNDGSVAILGPTVTLSCTSENDFPGSAVEPKVGMLPKRQILAISAMAFIFLLFMVALCQTLISLV
jgi:hypothetical protein